jgi:hypothetical protein
MFGTFRLVSIGVGYVRSIYYEEYRKESGPLFDLCGWRPVLEPTRYDRSVGDIASIWSRIVGTPSERIEDRSEDDLVLSNY